MIDLKRWVRCVLKAKMCRLGKVVFFTAIPHVTVGIPHCFATTPYKGSVAGV
jgi:hypothetical protein